MSGVTTSPELVSELAGDPDFRELVGEFVAALGNRCAAIEKSLADGDLARTAVLAHQLKGAAGAYGFPSITEQAGRLEVAARQRAGIEQVRARLDVLGALCQRARGPSA